MIEPRVGYATIDALCRMTEDYIKAHTIRGGYVGDVHYLVQYANFKKYLGDKK